MLYQCYGSELLFSDFLYDTEDFPLWSQNEASGALVIAASFSGTLASSCKPQCPCPPKRAGCPEAAPEGTEWKDKWLCVYFCLVLCLAYQALCPGVIDFRCPLPSSRVRSASALHGLRGHQMASHWVHPAFCLCPLCRFHRPACSQAQCFRFHPPLVLHSAGDQEPWPQS